MLEVRNLVKQYGKLTAVSGVSFQVNAGACFGLLGPNGAGKTTIIEMIEDVITPTSGDIRYRGEPRSHDFREEIGIQFQHTSLLGFLSVRETLETFADLYRNPAGIDELITLCSLGNIKKRMNDRISGGQRQRLLLALALVNRPNLLFLDEPSTGLDPHARWDLWQVVEDIKKNGKTIILTTHYMEEAQNLCDDIAIMDQGEIIARGSPGKLIRTHCKGHAVRILKDRITAPLGDLGLTFHETGDHVDFSCEDINACLTVLMEKGVNMGDIEIRSPNLETVFLNLTGRRLRE